MDKKYFTYSGNGKVAHCISSAVRDALIQFCEQEPEFNQAIEQSGKTFNDCLDEISKGVGQSISDIEVYRRAVKFYFPTADIHFEMRIDTCGSIDGAAQQQPMNLSLDSLLDF